MSTKRLVVALLLLTILENPAAAADTPEHQSKNARKVLAVLGAIGINNPEIKELVEKVDANIDQEGYYTLAQKKVPGGTLTLHYQLGNGINTKQIELQFAPDDSNWRATARTNQVMINYSYKF